jgi:RNA polymerase sigma factor (sigma-70 family)
MSPAPGSVIGGPSRFKRGMTRAGELSHPPAAEMRNGGRAYTFDVAPPGFARSRMPENTETPIAVSQRVEAAYRANYKLLSYLAAARFRIPEDEVCGVIHDVFVSFIRSEAKVIRTDADERAWLVGAVCNASRYYWRKHRGSEDLVDAPLDIRTLSEDAAGRVDLAAVLRELPERCRDLLCRRYVEGYTSEEIAVNVALTSGSTRNLISRCLLAAREAFSRRRTRRER